MLSINIFLIIGMVKYSVESSKKEVYVFVISFNPPFHGE